MTSIVSVLKIALAVLAGLAMFLISAVFVLMYLLLTGIGAVAGWCGRVWRRAVFVPHDERDDASVRADGRTGANVA